MSVGFQLFHDKIRLLFDRKYKLSLYLTILNISKHCNQTHQKQYDLRLVANKYISIFNATISQIKYNELWTLLKNLTNVYGGYMNLFVHHTSFKLCNTTHMWDSFIQTCFYSTKYTKSKKIV